jgi:hypothetical protein
MLSGTSIRFKISVTIADTPNHIAKNVVVLISMIAETAKTINQKTVKLVLSI